jgi:CRP/FNR family transcriptional regulator, cyclic AMP receptor protein
VDAQVEAHAARERVSQLLACPLDVAERILAFGRLRTYPIDAVLVRQGDSVAHAWLLMLGRARALLYTADGQLILLHEFGPGDLFGAIGEADPVQERADIVAAEAVEALLMEAGQLVLLAERHGSIGLALSRSLLRRLRQATVRIYERAALSAVGRIYAELLRQARESADLTIRPAPVLADLAPRVASTRETVSRAVNALERRGIIVRDENGLRIVAPHRLEELIL